MGTDAGGSGSPRRRAVGVGGIVGVMGLALIVLLFLPRNYRIQREIRIEAPPAIVFEQVVDLRKNPAWSPWVAADPGMQISYGPITRGVGASSSWTSSNAGRGSVRVEVAEAPTRIQNALGFGDLGTGEGVWTFEPVQEGETQVTWTLTAHAPGLLGGLFAVMADTMVGPSFEDGLSRLKQVAESGSSGEATAPDSAPDPVVEALRRKPIT